LTGSREERVIAKGHQRLSSYGALASSGPAVVRDWIEQLVRQGYLEKTGEYNVLTLTQKGTATSRGEETPLLSRPPQAVSASKPQSTPGRARPLPSRSRDDNVPARAATSPPAGEDNRQLFEKLRTVRRKKAEELEVPPFVIFSDAALHDMARRKPADRAGFLAVHGVGERKCEAFADEFLAVIREFCDAGSDTTAIQPVETVDLHDSAPRARERRSRSDTLRHAAALLAQGQSIGQVAETLGRKPSTVAQYLVEYIQQGGITDPTPWVKPAVFARIREAVATVGAERLSPIHEHLNGEVDYGTIRICMACLRNLQR
jgi:ATP-dependent DNA helicase RecQ